MKIDAVSRQDVINICRRYNGKGYVWAAIACRVRQLPSIRPDTAKKMDDQIDRQAAINSFIAGLEEIFADIRERHGDDSVCGLCEYDGAYIGESGDWYNECPGFDRDDCFKLGDDVRRRWIKSLDLPSAQETGKWENHFTRPNVFADLYFHCSVCGGKTDVPQADIYFKYCPYCGARMERGTDE